MTSDCYAILGVSPAAEDVVIGAAYRALMRHYHPDTNPDPAAQARAREITGAYAVLRDPAKRAEYDARRADGDLWSADDGGDAPRKPPPAMRTVGIASAALALALVATVWTMAEKSRPRQPTGQSQPEQKPAKSASGPADPLIQLEPESERLARLREEAEVLSPPPADETLAPDPIAAPAKAQSAPKATIVATVSAPTNERLAALDTMAANLFTQSMAHATGATQELLLGARNRSAAQRKACGSDSCVADAYVRQIRETSAIMDGRTGPP
ncbi:MAG TPA: J domain-containing protein [Sphingomicrobium sp.]|nr:J domain-containing protein [Sphingomicrobium sp.]